MGSAYTCKIGSLILIGPQTIRLTVGVCAVGAALEFKFEQNVFCARREEPGREERGEEKPSVVSPSIVCVHIVYFPQLE